MEAEFVSITERLTKAGFSLNESKALELLLIEADSTALEALSDEISAILGQRSQEEVRRIQAELNLTFPARQDLNAPDVN